MLRKFLLDYFLFFFQINYIIWISSISPCNCNPLLVLLFLSLIISQGANANYEVILYLLINDN